MCSDPEARAVRKLLQSVLLVLLSLAVGLAIAEISLRAIGYSHPAFYQPDVITGSRHRPGAEGWYDKESRVYVKMTHDGRRDREYPRAKADDVFRIAVFGDSMTEALQVALEVTYWSVLERALAACRALAGKRVEVLNFGVAGYGTAQSLLALRHRGWAYDPDLVLLGFFIDNDVSNNSRRLHGWPKMPYFKLAGDRLVLDESFRDLPSYRPWWMSFKSFVFALSDYLRTVQLVLEVYGLRFEARIATALDTAAVEDAGEAEQNLAGVFSEPADSDWREAWRVTEALIAAMWDEAAERGRVFWVAIIPGVLEVHPDPEVREAFARDDGVADLDYPHRRLGEFLRGEAIPYIALRPALLAHVKETGDYLHGFESSGLGPGHWNEAGHRIAGQTIVAEMCRRFQAGVASSS